jgi:hypothetical protein
VELVNFTLSRLSDSSQMTPWEVIQLSLAHMRPPRNTQWLADQLGMSIQAVSNWKNRGVPARHYREIASALGITVDQLEGIDRLPWEGQDHGTGLMPEVEAVAGEINALPKAQRDWVLRTVRDAIDLARETMPGNAKGAEGTSSADRATSTSRAKRA